MVVVFVTAVLVATEPTPMSYRFADVGLFLVVVVVTVVFVATEPAPMP